MSIRNEDWDALTTLAEITGTTRTELIREMIHDGISRAQDGDLIEQELRRTRLELRQAQEQLELVRRQLGAIANAMQRSAVVDQGGQVAA